MSKNPLTGSWKLTLFEFRRSDGEILYPLGMGAKGLLVYAPSGFFSMQISHAERPVFTKNYFEDLAPEELKIAISGYFAYFGAYEVDTAERTVRHIVEASLFPNWIGTEQIRQYELAHNRLTLTKPPREEGKEKRPGAQIWERID